MLLGNTQILKTITISHNYSAQIDSFVYIAAATQYNCHCSTPECLHAASRLVPEQGPSSPAQTAAHSALLSAERDAGVEGQEQPTRGRVASDSTLIAT